MTYSGRIVKGIAGFYYVYVEEVGMVECHARGNFRKEKIKPLVGDYVRIEILDDEYAEGIICEVLERKNQLIRPEIANVDQVMIVFACSMPEPNLNLLDKFMISMELQDIPVILCFNKCDMVSEEKGRELLQIYRDCGAKVILCSVKERMGLDSLLSVLEGKTTAVAGPSGVGKSTLTNYLCPRAEMETGEISRKLERGKHTTRHSELLHLHQDTYFMDTPGFSALMVNELEAEDLKAYYHEFYPYEGTCRYNPCTHTHEPGCGVKAAVEEGKIHKMRYESYERIYTELQNKKRYG